MSQDFANAPATLCLLVLNVGISLLAFSNRSVLDTLALSPFRMVARREYFQVITSGFVHRDYFHLLFNMVTFYSFGPILEEVIYEVTGSRLGFLFLYVFSLILGSLYPLIKYRRAPLYSAVGASGAISGIVFAFCMIAPMAELRLFFAIPMPAFVFALLYVGYSVYAMRNVEDNTAHEGHLGGALGGVIGLFLVAPQLVFFLR